MSYDNGPCTDHILGDTKLDFGLHIEKTQF